MVATSAEWAATERAERKDVSEDLDYVLVRGTKRATRWRTVPRALSRREPNTRIWHYGRVCG